MAVKKHVGLDTDNTLGGNNAADDVIASQKAIKEYVDNHGADTDLSNLSATGNQRIIWYGTCSTSASTQTKDVTCSGFTLATGASIRVYFQNAQSYGGAPKLNVNGTGAKSVYVYGAGAAQKYEWRNGAVLDFTYDGTYWIMVRGSHATTTYYGITILTDTVDTTTNKALSPNGAYLALQDKQDTLVSGTNIKTINNQSILGSGNINISGGSATADNLSITTNSNDELQTVGVIDQNNTTNAIKTWTGTKAQYDAITTKDANTIYNITDDGNALQVALETIYPVGSIYIGTMAVCPLSALFGTWELVSAGRVLQGSDTSHQAGTTIEAGLPNITGGFDTNDRRTHISNVSGAIYTTTVSSNLWAAQSSVGGNTQGVGFDASRSSSIYGNSNTVQPPAFVVNIWQRTA